MEELHQTLQTWRQLEHTFAQVKTALGPSAQPDQPPIPQTVTFLAQLAVQIDQEQERLQRHELERAHAILTTLLQPATVGPPPLAPTVGPPFLADEVTESDTTPSGDEDGVHDEDPGPTEEVMVMDVPPALNITKLNKARRHGLFEVDLGIIDLDYFTYNSTTTDAAGPPHRPTHRLNVTELEQCRMKRSVIRWYASANAALTKLCPMEAYDLRHVTQIIQLCIPHRANWKHVYGEVKIYFRQGDRQGVVTTLGRQYTVWRPINITARRLATLLSIKII